MAFPEDVFPADECCEICGIRLNDEVVIQEFADGSLARLCPECAAGAAFTPDPSRALERFPDDEEDSLPAFPADADPLEMTRELLVPVTDLISLQTEMQAALERLAASLERFATGVIVDTKDRTADVDSRLRSLEDELERTRTRLREAESLLVGTGTPAPEAAATGPIASPEPVVPIVPLPVDEFSTGVDLRESLPADEEWPPLAAQATGPIQTPTETAFQTSGIVPPPAPAEPGPAAQQGHGETFSLGEIQLAQRCFNESPFTERVRDVRHSLGKPKVNLSRIQGVEPRVLVTILWDIVWYQYLVNLRKEAPIDERVALFREGMDLDELAPHFKEKNASVDDDGRLDASELEVRLLSDPTVLITEMDADEERALEDATEEIWDQHIAPEFKWDD
jgi:hypothetical protein